jgi:hypothetical protein
MGRYPHPPNLSKFVIDWARSPPGTPRDLTTPSGHTSARRLAHRPARRLRQSKAEKCAARRTSSRQSEKRRPPDFTRAKSESPCPGGLFQSKAEKCAARRTFRRAKSESVPGAVPGGGSVCPPGRREKPPAREKKPGFFPGPYAHVKGSAATFFRKKNR